MTEQEAIEALKEHKERIDKEYIKARNSKAIEIVLNALKEKDKIIDSMVEEFKEKTLMYTDFTEEEIKQYFENKAKEK